MMMKSSRFEENKNIEENIIKDVRNLFRLRKLKKRNKVAQGHFKWLLNRYQNNLEKMMKGSEFGSLIIIFQ